jgi:acetyl-CoA C-acetyltransferase
LERDGFLRPDTTLEKLAALKPAFDKSSGQGTLTAGNSTGLSDGASAVLLSSEEWAAARGLKPKAYLTQANVAAVDFVHGEGLLMAPTIAVARMLDVAGLTLQDFDFYEIHEAFAAQVLCTLRAWESAEYCKNRLGRDKPLGAIDPPGSTSTARAWRSATLRRDRHAHRRRWPSCSKTRGPGAD